MRCFLPGSHFEGSFLFFIFLHFLLRTCTDHFRGVSTGGVKDRPLTEIVFGSVRPYTQIYYIYNVFHTDTDPVVRTIADANCNHSPPIKT